MRNEEQCNINDSIGQRMLGNFITDEDKTSGKRNVGLQKDHENWSGKK